MIWSPNHNKDMPNQHPKYSNICPNSSSTTTYINIMNLNNQLLVVVLLWESEKVSMFSLCSLFLGRLSTHRFAVFLVLCVCLRVTKPLWVRSSGKWPVFFYWWGQLGLEQIPFFYSYMLSATKIGVVCVLRIHKNCPVFMNQRKTSTLRLWETSNQSIEWYPLNEALTKIPK